MIKNRFVALAILFALIAGTLAFVFYKSPYGPLLTLAGIIAYFVFNKKDST